MVRPQLRERGAEVRRAHDALVGAASTGVGHVLVVTGEPGIGKTALLDVVRRDGAYEFELTLDNSSEFVLKISADEASTVMRGFQHSERQLFDTERTELIFGGLKG